MAKVRYIQSFSMDEIRDMLEKGWIGHCNIKDKHVTIYDPKTWKSRTIGANTAQAAFELEGVKVENRGNHYIFKIPR